MKSFIIANGQQDFYDLFECAQAEGAIRIRRENGQTFILKREGTSPLDIKGIDLNLSRDEIVEVIQEGRRKF